MSTAVMASPEKWLPKYCPPLKAVLLEGHRRTYGFIHQAKCPAVVKTFMAFAKEYFA